jgi:hypothetical protein
VFGDDHDEAYTAIVQGVGLSHEMAISQRPRSSMVPKAICAGLLCEALSLCRGLRPHHVRRDHVGTWETSPRPQPLAVQGRDGKPKRRSRRGKGEESDGVVVPVKRSNKAGMTCCGGRGGKDPAWKEGERTVTDAGLRAGIRLLKRSRRPRAGKETCLRRRSRLHF